VRVPPQEENTGGGPQSFRPFREAQKPLGIVPDHRFAVVFAEATQDHTEIPTPPVLD
jgi:hypothetical protein